MAILSTLKRLTTNFSFRIPVFDSPGWGRDLERNFDTIDAVLFAVTGFSNIRGVWAYSTAYVIGDRVVDYTDGSLWQCAVDHTSISEGVMNDDRTANPTYWTQLNLLPNYRGAWTTATPYNAYEFLFDGARFGVTVRSFTSGASYNADVTNGDILTLVDLSAYVIPNPTVALNFIRVNAGMTAYELRTPAQVRNDIGADNATNLASGTVNYARLPTTVTHFWSSSDAATDWDTLTALGYYNVAYRGDNPNGPTPSIATWFQLLVTGNNTGVVRTQLAIPVYGTGNFSIWYRSSSDSGATWSAWREIPSKGYLDTLYVALTGAQTIAGAKTFSSDLKTSADLVANGRLISSKSAVSASATPPGSESFWCVENGLLRAAFDSYQNNLNGVQIFLRKARGTPGTPAAIVSGDIPFYMPIYGHDGSVFAVAAGFTVSATENWSGTNRGTQVSFSVVPTGTASAVTGLLLGSDQKAYGFGKELLHVQGAQNLTGGFTSTAYNAGTFASGTYTPAPANGQLQRAINGGAHTLAAPTATGDYSITIQYTNNASAGAITFSGFTIVNGDSLTTVNGDDFFIHIVKINGFVRANVEKLQ